MTDRLSDSLARYLSLVVALVTLLASGTGCGGGGGGNGGAGGGGGGPHPPSPTTITGTVSAPGGSIGKPSLLRRVSLAVFGAPATSLTALPSVAGVTVELVTLDPSGNPSLVVASTTTDSSGAFTLTAPASFSIGLSFAIRAGSGTSALLAFATATKVDVSPYTQATVTLVQQAVQSSGTTLQDVPVATVVGLLEVVQTYGASVDPSNAASMAAALVTAVVNSSDTGNLLANLTVATSGGIVGTVTGPDGAPVGDALVTVNSFSDQQLAASVRTDAAGRYVAKLPAGTYALGVRNDGTASMAASMWWTAGGGTGANWAADPVVVGTTDVTRDLALPAGARLQGTVTAESGGAPLPGIRVAVRAFENGAPALATRTGPDGSWVVNMLPGAYYVELYNDTLQPYASELYSAAAPFPNGANNRLGAQRLDLVAGTTTVADASLGAGHLLQGSVVDPLTSTSVSGAIVRLQDVATGAGVSFGRLTDRDGTYHVWVRPESYTARVRGQTATVNLASGDQTLSFAGAVGMLTAHLQDGGGAPIGNFYAYAYDAVAQNQPLLGWEAALGDGSLVMYVPSGVSSVYLELKSDSGTMLGTTIYRGRNELLLGDAIAAPAPGTTADLGNLVIPGGGVLTGVVRKNGAPISNVNVQIRTGGTTGAHRLTTVRTRSDGRYTIGLPAGTYARICAYEATASCGSTPQGPAWAFADAVVISAGATRTLDLSYPAPTYVVSGAVSGAVTAGVTITLSGAANATTLTAADGSYSFPVPNGSYTLTPSLAGYVFSPGSLPVTVNGANQPGMSFTSAPVPHAIAGKISGAVASGVTVTLTGAASAVTTTVFDGSYAFTGLVDGNYRVTPTADGYAFSPAYLDVSVSGADRTGQDLAAAVVAVPHAIRGTVSGAVGAGVTVALSGASSAVTATGPDGSYAFTGLADGSYTVTPSLPGYVFSPPSLDVPLAGADQVGQDFTSSAVQSPHAITGTISGVVASGVPVTLSGPASALTTTGFDGSYAFTGLAGGNYTVTPALAGYVFAPQSLAVPLAGADRSGQDFVSDVALPPAAPVLVVATPFDGGAAVAWPPVPGATSYRVYYGATAPVGVLDASVTTPTWNAAISGLPNGARRWFAVSAVGPGGESALAPAACAVPSSADTSFGSRQLSLWDPLCDDRLDGSGWLAPGGFAARVANGAAELSIDGVNLARRDVSNPAMNASATVAAGASRVTQLSAIVQLPSASASRTGSAELRGAIRLYYQPPALRLSFPAQNQDAFIFEAGLMVANSGAVYAIRNSSHCDDAMCAVFSTSGITFSDPVGLTVLSPNIAGVAASYDTPYRVTIALDEATGLLSWSLSPGPDFATTVSGTVDPSAWVSTTPSWSGAPTLASNFSYAQLSTRATDPVGGGSAKLTGRYQDVWVGLNGGAPTLWDDFSGTGSSSGPTELSLARWNTLGAPRLLPTGGGSLGMHEQATAVSASSVGLQHTMSLPHPDGVDAIQADVTVPSLSASGSGTVVANVTVGGRFHNDGTGTTTGNAFGDIVANATLTAAGTASYAVVRCTNANCSTVTTLQSAGLPGSVTAGVVPLRAGYDRQTDEFVFGVGTTSVRFAAPAGATRVAPARAPLKRVVTNLSLPANAVGTAGAVDTLVNNVQIAVEDQWGGGAACTSLDPSLAPSVLTPIFAAAAPAPTGGAIVAGTYWLTAASIYTGTGGQTGASPASMQLVWTFDGSSFAVADRVGASSVEKNVGRYGVAGTELVLVGTCPTHAPNPMRYSASPTEVRVYQPAGPPTNGTLEFVLTRQ